MRKVIQISLLTFLLFELGLRMLPYFVRDPLKSLILEAAKIPNSNTRTYNGFHGGTRILLPPLQETDLLVVGDSIPFGTLVKVEDTFTERLAKSLSIRAINLSVASQAPKEYNQMLGVGLNYHPKAILYCIFANDFEHHPLEIGSLYLTDLDYTEKAAHAVKKVTNLSLAYQLFKFLQQPIVESSVEYQSIEENTRYAVEAKALAGRNHISFLPVLIPSKDMIRNRITYSKFLESLQSQGIKAIDLSTALEENLYHTIDGHLNETGHATVATLLQHSVQQLLLEKRIALGF